MMKLMWIALAGAVGTLARYGLSGLVGRSVGAAFPWGTVAVNLVGCLAFGLVWGLLESRISVSGQVRLMIFVGFFGAFTTFSTFAFETVRLLEDGQWLFAAGNVLLQTVVGLLAVIAGMAAGKFF
jgi:CrcB protein